MSKLFDFLSAGNNQLIFINSTIINSCIFTLKIVSIKQYKINQFYGMFPLNLKTFL